MDNVILVFIATVAGLFVAIWLMTVIAVESGLGIGFYVLILAGAGTIGLGSRKPKQGPGDEGGAEDHPGDDGDE